MSEPPGSGGETGDPPAGAEPLKISSPLSRLDPDRAAGLRAPDQPRERPSDQPAGGRDQPAGGRDQPAGGRDQPAGGGAAPAGGRAAPAGGRAAPPVVDNRRYRWMIGIIGLVLVIVVSVYQFATHGVGTTGVPAGHRLHIFAAPLADTNLEGTSNSSPTCSPVRHDPRALNVCLLVRQAPLVLAFFVTGSSECVHEVDALQTLSHEFPASEVRFAAVAIQAGHRSVAALVRSRRWTIPVAYDSDGSVGALYGVAVCPMAELAYRGGLVENRLIGSQWQTSAELAPTVRALVRGQRARDAG